MKNRLVLFDLDGVLLDSADNMRQSWAVLLQKTGLSIPFNDYFSRIGRPFPDIMELLGLGSEAVRLEKIYMTASFDFLRAATFFPGTVEILQQLNSNRIKVGVVTSKDRQRTTAVLQQLPCSFHTVQCPEKAYRGKPAPDYLLLAMAEANCDPADTLFIGDMETDHEAALRAGISYAHASWGYGEPIPFVPNLKTWPDLFSILK